MDATRKAVDSGALGLLTPSSPATVDVLVNMADLRHGDLIYDLGSGDGSLLLRVANTISVTAVGFEVNTACLARSRTSLLSAAPDLLGTSVTFVEKDIRSVTVNDSRDSHTIRAGPTTVVFLFLSRAGVATMGPLLQACVDAGARVATYLHHVHLRGRCTSRLGGMLRMYQREPEASVAGDQRLLGQSETVGHCQWQQLGQGQGHPSDSECATVGQTPCSPPGQVGWRLPAAPPLTRTGAGKPTGSVGTAACSPYSPSRQLYMGSPLHSAARDACGVYSSPDCDSASDSDVEVDTSHGEPRLGAEVAPGPVASPKFWGEAGESSGRRSRTRGLQLRTATPSCVTPMADLVPGPAVPWRPSHSTTACQWTAATGSSSGSRWVDPGPELCASVEPQAEEAQVQLGSRPWLQALPHTTRTPVEPYSPRRGVTAGSASWGLGSTM